MQQNNQPQPQKQTQSCSSPSSSLPQIILIIKTEPQPTKLFLDQRILKFGLPPLQHEDYSQPLMLPPQIITTQLPIQIVSRFAQLHNYNPISPKIKIPLTTNVYKDIVDQITYQICSKYTNLDLIQEIQQILKFVKWAQFIQLQRAIAAAVAVNYYTGYDQKQVDYFMKKNNLENITAEQIQQIFQQNKQLFNYVQLKTKQQFIKQSEITKTQ